MGYFNVENWDYMDFFFQEFIPHIDKKFNTIASKEGRAIAGLSMGGGGSFVYAQRHPEMFCAFDRRKTYSNKSPKFSQEHSRQKFITQHNLLLQNLLIWVLMILQMIR